MKNSLERVIKTDNGSVFTNYYHHHADQTLVFVHGNSTSSRFWHPFIYSELEKHCNILVWDLPGHGRSPWAQHPAQTYSLLSYAHILSTIVQEYSLQQYYLVGHSLGGHIILEAANVLAAAQGALIMGTPPLDIPPRIDLAFPQSQQILNFMHGGHDHFLMEQTFLSMLPEDKAVDAHLLLDDYFQTDPAAREYLLKNILSGNFINELEVIKNSPTPVHLVKAENDPMVSSSYFDQFLAEKEVITLPARTGHYAPLAEPEVFIDLIFHTLLQPTVRVAP